MFESELHLGDHFTPAGYQEWRALAVADLAGASFEQKLVSRTYEGIELQPVYTKRDHPGEQRPPSGFRNLEGFGSLMGWDLRQEHAHPDLEVTDSAIRDDVAGGVNSLLLRLDRAAQNGYDPDAPAAAELAGQDGIMIYHTDDLESALAGVRLDRSGVALEAGAAFVPAAACLVALWQRQGLTAGKVGGAFNADPFAVLARDGELPMPIPAALALMADLAQWTDQHYRHVTAVRVGTAPYHLAGATTAQDIAFSMATGLEYLRAMREAGMPVDGAARQILFCIDLGTHHFLAIAKLRALRVLWSGILASCGGSASACTMRIQARLSQRVLTRCDPYVNVLRNTAACFAAALGGADVITSVPFDAAAGLPTDFSRRLARNTVHILCEEGQLRRVIDPPGGSWYLDWLTHELTAKACTIFQAVECRGGMSVALRDGFVAQQIDSAFIPRARNLVDGKDAIIGVTKFRNMEEIPLVRPAPDLRLLRAAATRRALTKRLSSTARPPARSSDHVIDLAVQAAYQGDSIGQIAAGLEFHAGAVTIAPLQPRPFEAVGKRDEG